MQRIEGGERPEMTKILVNGHPVSAFAGESLAVALAVAGHRHLRDSPLGGTPRGAFCMMGVCQECVVLCDGRRVAACMTPVRAGMAVTLGVTE